MKTIFCVAAESNESGQIDWFPNEKPAQTEYTYKCADPQRSADTISLFSLEVPADASPEQMTRLADEAMWDLAYTPMNRRIGSDSILFQRNEESVASA